MSCVAAAFPDPLTPEAIIVDAARCWRETVDRHRPILPTLFARLEVRDAGFLAPAIAALLSILEAWSGRRFRAGDESAAVLTNDEQVLLGLLETAAPPAAIHASRPGLTGPLRVALRSTRIMIQRVLGLDLGERRTGIGGGPFLLGRATDEIELSPKMHRLEPGPDPVDWEAAVMNQAWSKKPDDQS